MPQDPQQVVWKVELPIGFTQLMFTPGRATTVDLPQGARILHLDTQGEDPEYLRPALWFQCDPERATVPRRFWVVPTGNRVPTDGLYVGTFLLRHGLPVFHVYELPS